MGQIDEIRDAVKANIKAIDSNQRAIAFQNSALSNISSLVFTCMDQLEDLKVITKDLGDRLIKIEVGLPIMLDFMEKMDIKKIGSDQSVSLQLQLHYILSTLSWFVRIISPLFLYRG